MKITRLLLLCCSCESTVFTSTNAKSLNDRAALLSIHRRNHNHNHNSLIHILRGGAATRNTPTTASNRRSTKTTAQPPVPGAYVKKINPHFAVLYGMILAFNSGLMNGVTLSGILSTTKQPSSAVTGSWTNSALGIASGTASHGNYLAVKCIISYMGGSFISGLLNPYPMNYSMKRNTVRPCFIIASLAMYISSVLVGNAKSAAGGCSNNNWILLIVLVNGIQNSITSTLTGNLMRSAHYSGITCKFKVYYVYF